MKRNTFLLLLYYLVIELCEFVIESKLYNYEADNWKLIISSQVAFSALMILPAPLLLASRLFKIRRDNANGYLSSRPWLTTLLIISLIALIGVSVLSYKRVILVKERYDVITNGAAG